MLPYQPYNELPERFDPQLRKSQLNSHSLAQLIQLGLPQVASGPISLAPTLRGNTLGASRIGERLAGDGNELPVVAGRMKGEL